MSEAYERNLTLHEAMIHALLECKLKTGTARMSGQQMASAISRNDSYRQRNNEHADAAQMFLRAQRCPEWFDHDDDAREVWVTLRPMTCGAEA